jgi:catechol 2,3-dioxygenase-like lactoylglutathione lyase family enzyme
MSTTSKSVRALQSKLSFVLLVTLLCLSAVTSKAQEGGTAVVRAVGPVGITVADMDRALDFYANVLSFKKVSDVEVTGSEYERLEGVFGVRMRIVTLRLGEESLELTEYLAPKGRPVPMDSRSNDRWFQHVAIIVSDMDRGYQWLRKNKVQHASSGPQRLPEWNQNAAGIEAFYFKDPDGHALEILKFPPGKGDAKWHRTDALFLGIDHTAIVVADTEASLHFYRDLLGLRIAGESENYGVEQEHLNNVFGARLRITSLRGSAGPGIELLEYLAPRDGKPAPPDQRANDLIHWQTSLLTADVESATLRLRSAKVPLVSSAIATIQFPNPGRVKAVLVSDPDGHAMELIQK